MKEASGPGYDASHRAPAHAWHLDKASSSQDEGLNAGAALDQVRDKALRSLLIPEQQRGLPEEVVQESKQ